MKQLLFRIKTLGLLFAVASLTAMPIAFAEGNHKGGHGAGAHWMSPKDEAEKPNPIKSDAASIERGKKILHGAMCDLSWRNCNG